MLRIFHIFRLLPTLSVDYYLSFHSSLHSVDGERPGSALMLTFPHHTAPPATSITSKSWMLPLPLSSSFGLCFQVSKCLECPFSHPCPPGRGNSLEKEPKLECRAGGGCAHTQSDEQRTRLRSTATRPFTGTPKERGSQRDVRGVVLQDIPFTFLYCLHFSTVKVV